MDNNMELRLVTFIKDGKQMMRYVYDTPSGFFDKQTIGVINADTLISLQLPNMKVTVEFTQ
jgi:hypothetical protein